MEPTAAGDSDVSEVQVAILDYQTEESARAAAGEDREDAMSARGYLEKLDDQIYAAERERALQPGTLEFEIERVNTADDFFRMALKDYEDDDGGTFDFLVEPYRTAREALAVWRVLLETGRAR
jgi:hypothetical protein